MFVCSGAMTAEKKPRPISSRQRPYCGHQRQDEGSQVARSLSTILAWFRQLAAKLRAISSIPRIDSLRNATHLIHEYDLPFTKT